MYKDFSQISQISTPTEIQGRLRLLRAEIRVKMALVDELIEQWEYLELTRNTTREEKDYEEEAS